MFQVTVSGTDARGLHALNRDINIDVYGSPLTANFKSYFDLKQFGIRILDNLYCILH